MSWTKVPGNLPAVGCRGQERAKHGAVNGREALKQTEPRLKPRSRLRPCLQELVPLQLASSRPLASRQWRGDRASLL